MHTLIYRLVASGTCISEHVFVQDVHFPGWVHAPKHQKMQCSDALDCEFSLFRISLDEELLYIESGKNYLTLLDFSFSLGNCKSTVRQELAILEQPLLSKISHLGDRYVFLLKVVPRPESPSFQHIMFPLPLITIVGTFRPQTYRLYSSNTHQQCISLELASQHSESS